MNSGERLVAMAAIELVLLPIMVVWALVVLGVPVELTWRTWFAIVVLETSLSIVILFSLVPHMEGMKSAIRATRGSDS